MVLRKYMNGLKRNALIRKIILPPYLLATRNTQAIAYLCAETSHSLSAKWNPAKGVTEFKRNREVIISLTTIPERISRVHLCLDSLLRQSLKPDRLVLWLSENNKPGRPQINKDSLPKALITLQSRGLEINWYDDIGSYRKLIPSLCKFPDALIVTADDDIIYPRHWLRMLYEAYLLEPDIIHCHRAHKMKFDEKGNLLPYREWDWMATNFQGPSLDLFPTSGSGVLFAPQHLDSEVLNQSAFVSLCPKADDVWFKAMSLLAKVPCKKVKVKTINMKGMRILDNTTLWSGNSGPGGNDNQIKAVNDRYHAFDQPGPFRETLDGTSS